MTDTYANYLRDLGNLLKERLDETKIDSEIAGGRQFEMGRYRAYREVLSLMLSQAEVFEIPPAALSLEGIDRERDLGC